MRRFSWFGAIALATVLSFMVSVVASIGGAVVCVFLYDRGTSKGNDLAVSLIGLHAFGTFTFVTVSTLFCSRVRIISWRVPIAALTACVVELALATILFSSSYDEYFAVFFYVAWVTVAVSGIAALGVANTSSRVGTLPIQATQSGNPSKIKFYDDTFAL